LKDKEKYKDCSYKYKDRSQWRAQRLDLKDLQVASVRQVQLQK